MPLPNLVYLGGPHGSGKTTFGERLASADPTILVPQLYTRNIKINTDPERRHMLKMGGRALENFEYLKIARENPAKVVLANRCIYDVQAYNQVYHDRGWISDELHERYSSFAKQLFAGENAEPYAIIVNPGIDVVVRHLMQRWEEKGKKWREDDAEYTRLACVAYEHLRGNPNVLYIDHEIDLEGKLDIDIAKRWVADLPSRTSCSQEGSAPAVMMANLY